MNSSILKSIAVIIFALAGAGGLLMFILLAALNQAGAGFLYLVIALFTGFVSYSVFAALAAIIDQNYFLNEKIAKLEQINTAALKNTCTPVISKTVQEKENAAVPEEKETAPVIAVNTDKKVVAVKAVDGKKKCPLCGTVQPEKRKVCWECGAQFED